MPARSWIGGALCAAALSLAAAPAPALAAASSDPSPHTLVRVQQLGRALFVVRTCEASGNYHADTGNGYFGAYQFSTATWHALGLTGLPSHAPRVVQDAAAVRLHDARHSWADWGACGGKASKVHV